MQWCAMPTTPSCLELPVPRHVTRHNNRQRIFLDSKDYEKFLQAVGAFLGCHPAIIIWALEKLGEVN